MSIVCTTDFSASSRNAARIAQGIALRLKEELFLVHVVEMPTVGSIAGEIVALPAPGYAGGHADEALAAEASLLAAGGVKVTPRLAFGETAAEILAVAHDTDASVVICGSHSRSAPGRLLLGSVADRLVSASDRPVLVVRGATSELTAWSESKSDLGVLVAIGDGDAPASMASAVASLGLAGAKFYYATVIDVPSVDAIGLAEMDVLFVASADPWGEAERVLRSRIADASLPEPASPLRILAGRPAQALTQLAEAMQPGLVVVGTHGPESRGRLGTMAQAILHHAPMPVLVVPAQPPLTRH